MPKLFMEIDENAWFEYKRYLNDKNSKKIVNLNSETIWSIIRKMGFVIVKEQYSVNAEKALIICDTEFRDPDSNDTIMLHQEHKQYVFGNVPCSQVIDVNELQKIADELNKKVKEDMKWE